MKPMVCTASIAAPAERVYALLTDIRGWPGRVRGIRSVELLTEGPVGPGTRFRETRVMFGREATEEMTVAELDPPRLMVLTASSHGANYRATHALTETPGGVEVSVTFEASASGALVRILAAVMGPLTRGAMKKCLEDDLADLKAACESGAGPVEEASR